MNPQVCLERIIAVADRMALTAGQDAEDEKCWAMCDLWQWLQKGGTPPVVQDLGNHERLNCPGLGLHIRREDNGPDGYEMIRRSPISGEIVKRHAFPTS
jgi:hypothetical protein